METRKLISFGKNSYIISLPKEWLKLNNLKKGDLIYLDFDKTNLRLLPAEKKEKYESKKITLETTNKTLFRIKDEIISAYLMSYNLIELIGDNIPDNITDIKSIIRDLSGLEIMEISSKRVVAHDILNVEDVNLTNIIRRIDMIVRSMLMDTFDAINTRKGDDIIARDSDVNRLVFLSFRVLAKAIDEPQFARKLNISMKDLFLYKRLLTGLESIADQVKRIARIDKSIHLNENTKKDFKIIFENIQHLYLELMKSFYTQNRDLAFLIISECKIRNADCDKFLEKNPHINFVHTISYLKILNSQIKQIGQHLTTLEIPTTN